MEFASPSIRVIARFHYFLPALAVCTVGGMLGGYGGAAVLYLSHGLFGWGAYGVLRSAADPPARSALSRLPAQLLVLVGMGVVALLLLAAPTAVAMRQPGVLGYVLLGAGALVFLIAGLRLWPTPGVVMASGPERLPNGAIGQLADAVRTGWRLNRGEAERTIEGTPLFVGFWLIALAPFGLAVAGWGPQDAVYWWVLGAGLLLGAPFIHTYLISELTPLLQEAPSGAPRPAPSARSPASVPGRPEGGIVDAVRSGDVRALNRLIDEGADVNQAPAGVPLLIAAMDAPRAERTEIIELLISAGAPADAVDGDGCTALHHAAAHNDIKTITVLLGAGAEIDAPTRERRTPLGLACVEGHWAAARLLVESGAAIEPEGAVPPLHDAAMASGDEPAGVQLLLEQGADVDTRGRLDRTALLGAALKGNAMIAEALLEAGADINARDQFGNTALMEASRAGANGVLERFVLWKPDTEPRDKPGRTALLVAVASQRADSETVRLLRAMGADPQARNREGRSAGELAAAAGRWQIARALDVDVAQAAEKPATRRQPQPVSDQESPRIIDLEVFETQADRDWAKQQLTNRSRTQLQAAGGAEEATAVVEKEPAAPVTMADGERQPDPEVAPEPARAPVIERPRKTDPEPEPAAEQESRKTTEPEPAGNDEDLDSVADIDYQPDEPVAGEGETVDAPSEPAAPVAPASERDKGRAGYQSMLSAATQDDLEQMQTVLDHEDDIPEWWLTSAFLNAVAAGRMVAPTWLLDHGLNANARSEAGTSLLACIARQSPPNLEMLEALLDHGARADDEPLLLHWLSGHPFDQEEGSAGGLDGADEKRLAGLLERLIERGADPAAVDRQGRTPLHWAARYRHPLFAEKLLEHGAPADVRDAEGTTPLMMAAIEERTGTVRVLMKHGADPQATSEKGVSALSVAMERQDHTLIKMLMSGQPRAAAPDRVPEPGDMIEAAAAGNLGRVKRLLSRDIDVDARDSQGCTALLRACGRGHAEVVSALLSAGADPNIAARNQTSPLGAAVLGNHGEIVNLLCDRGVDADQRQQYGITPLMLASARWLPRIVVTLLRYEADPDARDETEGTPLMAAVQNAMQSNDVDAGAATMKFLLRAGADVDAANDEGQTSLMLLLGVRSRSDAAANEQNLLRLARMLIEHGADVDRQDLTGWSALHAAAAHGFRDTAAFLMDSGASRRLRDINGLSPVDLAMDHAHDALVDLFIQRG